jgi:hypothetical protein
MKRFIFLCIFLILVSLLIAQDFNPTLEIKSGYFFFSEKKMRKIYDDGGQDVQLCGSYPIWRFIQLYGSIEYLSRHGKSLNIHQKTRIYEVPLSLGINSIFKICEIVQWYATVGPRYFFFHQHNQSIYVDKNIHQNGFGCFVNTGFKFFPVQFAYVDYFGEYSYGKLHFSPSYVDVFGSKIQVGGFTFGGGLGICF